MSIRTNLGRVLNIGGDKRGDWTRKTLSACSKAFDKSMSSSMPIPSQSMEINVNNQGNPATLYISDDVYQTIRNIAQLQYQVDKIREDMNRNGRTINFYCTGYVLDSGDYVITGISVPIVDYIKSTGKYKNQLAYGIATAKIPAAFHIESTAPMMDYLKNTVVNNNPYLAKNFAIYGVTKSRLSDKDNLNNCFTLKEVADSIIPEISTSRDVASGVLSITPVTENFSTTPQGERVVETISMNSLECLVTHYSKNSDNTVKPLFLEQVTRACTMNSKQSISIGESSQPYALDDFISYLE